MKRNIRLPEFFFTFNSLKSINFLKVYMHREVESNSSNTGGKILCRRFEESLGKYYGTIVARTAACILDFRFADIFSTTDFREWRASPGAYFRAR